MQLSIIIPTKDRASVFQKTIAATVQATAHLACQIVVVNDSTENMPIVPEAVTLIQNPGHGVASARNAGAKLAKARLLLFLDNDILISKASIDHTLATHQQLAHACINPDWVYPEQLQEQLAKTSFGRFLKTNKMTTFEGWYGETWKSNQLFQSKSVASFHLSILKADFDRVGGYTEGFPHAGFEDYDFPKRLKAAGLTFYIDSRIQVLHNEEDRMDVDNWLNNQQRRAETRRVAVNMGYTELILNYAPWKAIMLRFINLSYACWRAALGLLSAFRLDYIYMKCISVLVAARIYKGYNLNKS
ncbi:MAG: glycosyltransferase family 2 protein [Cyclobacteriaceae bacterium]|nr:glycosyltransferase family 2 protein [Cyclobacteriaceae bacterium]